MFPDFPSPASVAFALFSPFLLATGYWFFRLEELRRKIGARGEKVIDTFFQKVDKIPVIVETIRKHAPRNENYSELVKIHRKAILTNVGSVYDVLENDVRISQEFRFLMRLSMKIREINRDGNFLYARSLWMYHENVVRSELERMDEEIRQYENLRKSRAFTLFGVFIPAKEILPVSPK